MDLICKRHPTSKVLVLRIFPRGGDSEKGVSPPEFKSSAKCIETCRRAGELTAQLADGKQVFWLDVNRIFLRPDGTINTNLMWDLLHPSPAGAEAWAQAVEPTLTRLMGDNPQNPMRRQAVASRYQTRPMAATSFSGLAIERFVEFPLLVGERLGDQLRRHVGEPKTLLLHQPRPEQFEVSIRRDAERDRRPIGVGQAVRIDQPTFRVKVFAEMVLAPESGDEGFGQIVGMSDHAASLAASPTAWNNRANSRKA